MDASWYFTGDPLHVHNSIFEVSWMLSCTISLYPSIHLSHRISCSLMLCTYFECLLQMRPLKTISSQSHVVYAEKMNIEKGQRNQCQQKKKDCQQKKNCSKQETNRIKRSGFSFVNVVNSSVWRNWLQQIH